MTNVIDVKYSKQELTTYAESSDTCVSLVRKTRVILLQPLQLSDLRVGVRENLDSLLLKYDFLFKSIILGYNRIKILSKFGAICYGRSKVQIEADFYLFNPAVGSKLQGVVCKRSGHHLGCLVHKAFNVYIPIRDNGYTSGLDYSIGQDITFTVVNLDLTSGRLPYIRGQLDVETAEGNDGDCCSSQVGTDSGTSFSHEEEAGGWDSGVALSSPGKDTMESEETEEEDKCNYGMKKRVGESMVTSKAIQLAARNKKSKLKNKMNDSPKTDGSGEELTKTAKVSYVDEEKSNDKGMSSTLTSPTFKKNALDIEDILKVTPLAIKKKKSKSKGKMDNNLKDDEVLKDDLKAKENSFVGERTHVHKDKELDNYATSHDYVKSDDALRQLVQETVGGSESLSTDIPFTAKKKSISRSNKNMSPLKTEKCIKESLVGVDNSIAEGPETSSTPVKSDGKTGNAAQGSIGRIDMSNITPISHKKKGKSKSKKNGSASSKKDLITELLKSMERSFADEEPDISEKKELVTTVIMSPPVKVAVANEEIDNDDRSKLRIPENKGDSGISLKNPSSTTKKRKSTSNMKNIGISEKKDLESGDSLNALKEPIKDEDSKLRQEVQKKIGKSGSPSVDFVLAVKKKSKSKNSRIKSPLKTEKCLNESLGSVENSITEGSETSSTPVKSDGKTGNAAQEIVGRIDITSKVTPLTAKKKGKSKTKKNGSSPNNEDMIKQLLKSMERSFVEEETDISEKRDSASTVVMSPPAKVAVASEEIDNDDDKSKLRTQESSEDSGVPVKNSSSTTKKRKNISKVKKVVEMPIVEPKLPKDGSIETNYKEETTAQQSIKPTEIMDRVSLETVVKVTGKNEKARESTGSLEEKDELSTLKKELVTGSNSENMSDDMVESYTEQIKKHILAKFEALGKIKSKFDDSLLNKKKKSSDSKKSKRRKTISNVSIVSSDTTKEEKAVAVSSEVNVESEIEKLIAMNKKLLGISQHGSEGVSKSSGSKGEIPSLKERKTMKRKRESKDLAESPQRKKVAKRHSDKLDNSKVLDVLSNSLRDSAVKIDNPLVTESSETSVSTLNPPVLRSSSKKVIKDSKII